MSNSNNTTSSSISLGGLIFVLFLGLKLTDNIDWSWWWVTSPLWIPVALVLSIIAVIFTSVGIASLCKK